jgi:toxin CcdB
MSRFDVFKNNSGTGYLLDVQTDLLSGLNTRVVVPLLLTSEGPEAAKYLNPIFQVDKHHVVMTTQFIAAVPESELSHFCGNLSHHHHEINSALDMIFSGF